MARCVTDARGGEVARSAYGVWGEPTGGTGRAPVGGPGFTGGTPVEGTEYVALGDRLYDARVGAFASADTTDPDVTDVADINGFAYAGGDPESRVDPEGHDDEELFGDESLGGGAQNPISTSISERRQFQAGSAIYGEDMTLTPSFGPSVTEYGPQSSLHLLDAGLEDPATAEERGSVWNVLRRLMRVGPEYPPFPFNADPDYLPPYVIGVNDPWSPSNWTIAGTGPGAALAAEAAVAVESTALARPYNRAAQFGTGTTRGPVADAIRAQAEGQVCRGTYGCGGQRMVSGTKYRPVPEHWPPLTEVAAERGATMTLAEGKQYARSAAAFDGAMCLRCQLVQGSQYATITRMYNQLMRLAGLMG